MSKNTFSLGLFTLVGLVFSQMTMADGVGNTRWDLRGSVAGRIDVSCKAGVRRVSAGVSAKKFFKAYDADLDGKMDARIAFGDGITGPDGAITGSFSWSRDEMSSVGTVASLTGTWRQEGNALFLHFDDWAASPIAVASTAMTEGFSAIAGKSYADGAATLSIQDTNQFSDNVKYVFQGRVNSDGTSLKISEVFGFGFTATGSALGATNTCAFRIANFGRSYKGTPSSVSLK